MTAISPSQDTAARLKKYGHLTLAELMERLEAAEAELSRHRTPSVPGEDMREKARKFVGLHHFGGGVFSDNITLEALREFADEIATLLSSTAALAREDAAQHLQAIAKSLRAEAVKFPLGPARDIILARADSYETGAAAIRAIGKEG